MNFEDEKDYIMRIIKEMVRVLFSLILGKQYQAVILPGENKADALGKEFEKYRQMADQGYINEAENEILENTDYSNISQVCALIAFYEHLSTLGEDFLREHDFSMQEVLDGLRQAAEKTGYRSLADSILEE